MHRCQIRDVQMEQHKQEGGLTHNRLQITDALRPPEGRTTGAWDRVIVPVRPAIADRNLGAGHPSRSCGAQMCDGSLPTTLDVAATSHRKAATARIPGAASRRGTTSASNTCSSGSGRRPPREVLSAMQAGLPSQGGTPLPRSLMLSRPRLQSMRLSILNE